MVTPLQKLVALTEEMERVLDDVTQKNRQEKINKVIKLLNDRETALKELAGTTFKRDLVIEQLQLDEARIVKKMEQVLSDIKNDMQMVQKKRKTTKNYINPYQNIIQDGVFFDRKK